MLYFYEYFYKRACFHPTSRYFEKKTKYNFVGWEGFLLSIRRLARGPIGSEEKREGVKKTQGYSSND